MNFVHVSKQNTLNLLASAPRVTKAWRDDILVVNSTHGISVDEADARLWVDVMPPTSTDTWIAMLVPAPDAHRDVVAAALAHRARHYALSLSRDLVAA